MPFEDLQPDEKVDFRKRLARLDVDENALLADELVVPAASEITLTAATESGVQPRILKTSNLDKVRQWVGIPEAILESELRKPTRRLRALEFRGEQQLRTRSTTRIDERLSRPELAAISGVSAPDLIAAVQRFKAAESATQAAVRLKPDQLEVLRTAAYAYVRGDKQSVEIYKGAIERFFGFFEIAAWLFTTVRVEKNSVLTFGPGVHKLTAYKVVLEPGAKIRSYGHLTVDCTILERKPKLNIQLPPHVITGTFPRRFP